METKIHINDEPFAETRYYSGIYAISNEENPDDPLEFSFTLSAQLDENSDFIFVTEVTWTDTEPPGPKLAEEQIRKFWKSS